MWTGEDPHDRWVPDGPVGRLAVPLEHHAYRDLNDHLRTVERYARLQAAAIRASGRPSRWYDWTFRPFVHLAKALLWKGGLLDGRRGVAIAFIGAAHVALKWVLAADPQMDPPVAGTPPE